MIGNDVRRAEIDLGDEADSFHAAGSLWAVVTAGDGDDRVNASGRLDGGRGDDSLTVAPVRQGYGIPRRWVYGGLGDDVLQGASGAETLDGGRGEDRFRLAGPAGRRDGSRDTVQAVDDELDSVDCEGAGRSDRLLLEGLDWPHRDERGACNGLSRSSPARAIPSYILSPDYERVEYGESRGTWVDVYCPHDVPRVCEGTISVQVTGHKLGPKRFRLRPGRDREFEVAPGSYDDGECENDVPARVTVRTRRNGRVFSLTRVLPIPPCPYDGA